MLELVQQLPDQIESTESLVQQASIAPATGVRRVVVCGMGGSAAAGALAQGVLQSHPLQLEVQRSYRAPADLHDDTLVVFSSYSGSTEETLEAYEDCAQRYPSVRRLAITSGGTLAQYAERDGVERVSLPGGLPPRAALGYSAGILFRVLEQAELVAGLSEQLREAVVVLRQGNELYAESRPMSENPAQSLARRLYGKLPLLYAASGLPEAAAWRWKAQINENSKALAAVGVLPEIDHNEIVGWEVASPIRDLAFVVALRDAQDHPRVQRRFDITQEVLGERVHGWETVQSRGQSPVARALSLVQMGDFLSVYLAREYGVDAMPVDLIDQLKARLADLG